MISRLLESLDDRILSERDLYRADCLRLERAVYIAREGKHKELPSIIDPMRAKYLSQPRAEISVWLHLVDGLSDFYNNMGKSARDRVLRAYALSTAARLPHLHALSAAWLAHMDYARLDIEAMHRHIGDALRTVEVEDHNTLARASLVMAQALHLANRLDLASPWYTKVRLHASMIGDDLTLSAMMHNMAWLRMSSLRQALLFDLTGLPKDRLALMSAESTEHFDELIGSTSWNELMPALKAQILSLLDRPSEALNFYGQAFSQVQMSGADRLKANLLADCAWCKARSGLFDAALSDALTALESFRDETQSDDRAAAHSRLSQVFESLGRHEMQKAHAALGSAAWANYVEIQQKIVLLLSPLSVHL